MTVTHLPVYAQPNCAECPFATGGLPTRPVAGVSPENPLWIAIGEGPGSTETQVGGPFCGPAGQLLNRALKEVGAARETLLITNATSCQPPSNANDKQKQKARECCAPRLTAELARHPKIPVLALGAIAAQGLLGDKFSITQMAGSLFTVDVDGTGPREIIPTVHPAAILRGGGDGGGAAHVVDLLYWNLKYDVAKVDGLAKGKDLRFKDDIDIEWQDPARALALVKGIAQEIRDYGEMAVDTETYCATAGRSALSPRHASLTAIGIGTPRRAISVAWITPAPERAPFLPDEAKAIIAELLADETIVKVMHNRIYDRPVLRYHYMPVVGRCEDTLLMHHSAFPGLSHNLQRVGTQFMAIPPWKSEHRDDRSKASGKKKKSAAAVKRDQWDVTVDGVESHLRYNARDTLVTARLKKPLTVCVQRARGERTYEVDLFCAEIAERMGRVGVPFSHAVNHELELRFKADLAKAEATLMERAADPKILDDMLDHIAFEQAKTKRKNDTEDFMARYADRLAQLKAKPWEFVAGAEKKKGKKAPFQFSASNNLHLLAYLKSRGVKLVQMTAKGKTSTKRDVLENLIHVPEVRAILEYREAQKMLSTFVIKYAKAVDDDGRMRPRWSVHKITGRWGADSPQVMNVPKSQKKKNRPNLRTQIVAPLGRIFVGFDFAQLEARIIALLSGDPFLVRIFAESRDIHTEFARIVWPNFDSLEPGARKEMRDMIKRPEYGAFYGGSIETLWKAVVKDYPKVKQSDIALMVKMMTDKMPLVTAWQRAQVAKIMTDQEVRSFLYGRRRAFPLQNGSPNEAINFGVQAAGADIMAYGLQKCIPLLKPEWEIDMQIHDACVFECPESAADELGAIVKESFAQEHTLNGVTVKFPVDLHIGPSWDKV